MVAAMDYLAMGGFEAACRVDGLKRVIGQVGCTGIAISPAYVPPARIWLCRFPVARPVCSMNA